MTASFWRGRRVFLTGHTGFKGAWLALWLKKLGADVAALALAPPTSESLFQATRLADDVTTITGDIRDYETLFDAVSNSRPSVVFHLAAIATVADGYRHPRDTFATNVTGTTNLLDAIRGCPGVEAAVIVTSDKCYAPLLTGVPLVESDRLGGKDPYSASKSAAEIAVAAWRQSFFADATSPRIATARAGKVIGAGDWSAHRLIPDAVRAFHAGQALSLRMPSAVRPWQHVLEALGGYLRLAEQLCGTNGRTLATSWNFGPAAADNLSVSEIATRCAELWGDGAQVELTASNFLSETETLRLDASHTITTLGWTPRWSVAEALQRTLAGYRLWYEDPAHIRAHCHALIDEYGTP